MSGGGHKQSGGGSSGLSIPMPQAPRQDPLSAITGMGTNLQGKDADPDKIKALLAGLSGSQQMMDPAHAVIGGFQNKPVAAGFDMGQMAKSVGQNAMGGGMTAGLGAGDAAAAAARSAGANLPGAASADAVAGIQGQMSEQMRESIKRKMEIAKMMMGGG